LSSIQLSDLVDYLGINPGRRKAGMTKTALKEEEQMSIRKMGAIFLFETLSQELSMVPPEFDAGILCPKYFNKPHRDHRYQSATLHFYSETQILRGTHM
jgi:hypothetical protein